MVLFNYDDQQAELGHRLYHMAREVRKSSHRLEETLEAFRNSEASDPLYGLLALAILPKKEDLEQETLDPYQAVQLYQDYKDAVEHECYPDSENIIRDNQETPQMIPLANITWELQYKPRGHRIHVDDTFITSLEITLAMIKTQES